MQPDYSVFDEMLIQKRPPRYVPLYEHFVDGEVVEEIMGFRLSDPDLTPEESKLEYWRKLIKFYVQMGYDYLPMDVGIRFSSTYHLTGDDTAVYSRGQRSWVNEESGPIQTIADLENPANWPALEVMGDFALFETVCKLLPPGMKILGGFAGGPFEHASFQMGLEHLSIAVYEEPEFVDRFFNKVNEYIVYGAARVAQLDGIGAYRFGDDLGYKTATMLSPANLRQWVFPTYKRVVDVVHAAGKPFVLHCCGNLEQVMDDIIDTGVDAKHSFEDVIIPMIEAKKRWGERIALFGGLDVDYLCNASEAAIKERTKTILDACAPGGNFAIGSGNTIANYIPVKNYLAMVSAVHEWNGR